MKQFDVVILGAGASGTMCALSTHNQSVALIDSATKVAKKVLVTGNGRCNLTNTDITGSTQHYNRDVTSFMSRFGVKDTLQFFASLGLEYYEDEQKRVYPISNMAKSVTDVLENALNKTKVKVFLEHTVLSVTKQEQFVVQTDKETFLCNKLVIAMGGNPKGIFDELDIDYKPYVPSLCALKTRNTKLLSGIRLDNVAVRVTNYDSGKTQTGVGEVLFKDSGLSGIVVFDLSTLFSRSGNFDGLLALDIFPQWTEEQLTQKLQNRRQLHVPVSEFFEGMLASGLAYEVFERCQTDENRQSNQISNAEVELFAKTLKNLTFSVSGNYDNNQVFSGGVPLEQLTSTLQSKAIPNLFFCGEVCDVDGLCGGYNLQWAWTSGFVVGQSL